MTETKPQRRWQQDRRSPTAHRRVGVLSFLLFASAALLVAKLALLQIVQHNTYEALASGQHQLFQELQPTRGTVYMHDGRGSDRVVVAGNQELGFIFAEPRLVKDPFVVAQELGTLLGYTPEQIETLRARLDQPEDPYEPIFRGASAALADQIRAKAWPGIRVAPEQARLYPEPDVSGHVLGFIGSDAEGKRAGRYGIEGFFDDVLTGKPGFLRAVRDGGGREILSADRAFEPAQDGSDVLLTLDRTLQFVVCDKLKQAVARHQADGGSVVIVEPKTGRVLAMCGMPDFDPNAYRDVADIRVYNNPSIFLPYESGSIFKPITMAAALDVAAVEPTTVFHDSGSVMVEGWPKPLYNAEQKRYGDVSMTQVLEDSINTGMVYAMRQMGREVFAHYVRQFGFGEKTGVELETESAGNVAALTKAGEIYYATASFGQGITVTPMQMAMAYAAIANGGTLYKPIMVDEIRGPDGTVETRAPEAVRRVISQKTAGTLGAMLVSVVEEGHGKRAGVPGYYIAGKTGTAQVPKPDGSGYENDVTIGSFAGFGPVENPTFAMIVRIDHPRDVPWAESTAAPLFGEIAEFLLRYQEVPPERDLE